MDAFLKALKQHTKVTFYVLPLLKLNKFSFDGRFIESYITRDGGMVSVLIKWTGQPITLQIVPHPDFMGMQLQPNSQRVLWYLIPPQWEKDIRYILQGRYGELSEEAKSMIRTYSGLPYRMPVEKDGQVGYLYTDYRLLALDRDPLLRMKMEELVGEPIPSPDVISPPGDEDFREYK